MKNFTLFSKALLMIFVVLGVFLLSLAQEVQAGDNQDRTFTFMKCPNPGGTVKASYENGWHWIAGNQVLQWGSDKVYDIGGGNIVQCFCPLMKDNNTNSALKTGMQTNFLKAGLTNDTRKDWLLNNGWMWIANGADFGLEAVPYFAKNIPFNCGTGSTCEVNIRQENHTVISNTVRTENSTGSNKVSDNTGGKADVKTGNASSINEIHNEVNRNSVRINDNALQKMKSVEMTINGNGALSRNQVRLSR